MKFFGAAILALSAAQTSAFYVQKPKTFASKPLPSFNYDPNGQFEYLKLGESVTDSFNYTVSDGNG